MDTKICFNMKKFKAVIIDNDQRTKEMIERHNVLCKQGVSATSEFIPL